MSKPTLHNAYIALGSNIGDRYRNLQMSLYRMEEHITIVEKSSIYETPPWGVTEQPAFLNQVVRATTLLTPTNLLGLLKHIEYEMGRVETIRYGPRLIDLDILLYDEIQLNQTNLTIPHAQMRQRAFVLVPLADIAPDLIIPGEERSVCQFLSLLDINGIKKYANEESADEVSS